MRAQFLEALVQQMGCDPALLGESGVTVKGHPDRAENHVTAGYIVGSHFVITCDPAVETSLVAATADMAPTFDAWAELAAKLDGELLGTGRMQLLDSHDLDPHPAPPGYTVQSLHRDDPADYARIERLVEAGSEDDLDDAEIELDDLDEIIVCALDGDGEIAAFSSGRPFDLVPRFGDIGVMTREDSRKLGLGRAAVAALCPRLIAANLEPLYRCDQDNEGSISLSASLGFTPVTNLVAYRFPTDEADAQAST